MVFDIFRFTQRNIQLMMQSILVANYPYKIDMKIKFGS